MLNHNDDSTLTELVETPTIRRLKESAAERAASAYIPSAPCTLLAQLRPLGLDAACVGLLLWREMHCHPRAETALVSVSEARGAGVPPRAFNRGVIALERAGLVETLRRPGCRVELCLGCVFKKAYRSAKSMNKADK